MFLQQLNSYLDKGVYDSEVSDVCLSGLCNALSTAVNVFEVTAGNSVQQLSLTPSRSPTISVFNLLRSGISQCKSEHFDVLVVTKYSHDTKTANMTVLPSKSMKRNHQTVTTQICIDNMFRKKIQRTVFTPSIKSQSREDCEAQSCIITSSAQPTFTEPDVSVTVSPQTGLIEPSYIPCKVSFK